MSKHEKISKTCIFCGKKPDKKNKEHIIPKWLINLTGEASRVGYFGPKINSGGPILPVMPEDYIINDEKHNHRFFSFSSFTFPACAKCNSSFSKIENSAKHTIEIILTQNKLNAGEVSTLLDWMDKVRVGLWLGRRQLDENFFDVEPNFYINDRVGKFDRALIIKKIQDIPNGINFIGTDSFSFAKSPTTFGLRINNYLFISISAMFLFSKEIGFPYYDEAILDKNSDGLDILLKDGTEKLENPMNDFDFKSFILAIYQPMVPSDILQHHIEKYQNEYYKENCINSTCGRGKIFANDGLGIQKYDTEQDFDLSKSGSYQNEFDLNFALIDILNIQNKMWEIFHRKTSLILLSNDQRLFVEKTYEIALEFNMKYCDVIRNSILIKIRTHNEIQSVEIKKISYYFNKV